MDWRPRLILLLLAVSLSGCRLMEELGIALGQDLEVVKLGKVRSAKLREPSGLAASQRYRGVYWTHNDSDHPPELFAIDSLGTVLKVFRVSGAKNEDWEDLTLDPDGNLYIADTGDNDGVRNSVVVYRLREPDPFGVDTVVTAEDSLRLRYPSGVHYNCEAVFWKGGRLYLLTKTASFRDSTVCFSVDVGKTGVGVVELVREGARSDVNLVTAAEYSPAKRRLAVLSYTQLIILGPEVDPFPYARKRTQAGISLGQCEGVCWNGSNLMVVNEAGEIFRISGFAL